MTYNFNTNPYYDDFDENKGFQRILFKPGFAVQARELTQLQTILQNQIDKFGQHFFQDGSIILGGQFNVETNFDCVKVTDNLQSLINTIGNLEGKFVVGRTTGIKAFVKKVAYRADWNYSFDVLMVRYLSSGTSTSVFAENEVLSIEGTNFSVTTVSSAATSKGSIFEIQEGVAFAKGFFTKFESQSIILDPLDRTPDCKVGFDVNATIVTPAQDTSLLDPALGSYNFSAPGADRLRTIPELIRLQLNDTTTAPEFYSLFVIEDGELKQIKERTQYSRILDEFAKRTYDESGNYVVRGFQVRTREHKDTGENEGYSANGDANLIAVGVESGTAYVFGYEINKQVTEYTTTPKSTTSVNVNSEIISVSSGNYLTANQVVGSVILDNASVVNFYNQSESRVKNNKTSTAVPTGEKVGTAKVKSVVKDGSNYLIYLSEVAMLGSNNFSSNVKSLGTSSFFADVVLTGNSAVLQDAVDNGLIYKLGSDFVKTNRSSDGTIDTTFTFQKTAPGVTIGTGGIFSVTITSLSEIHSYGVGSLSSADKSEIILSLNSSSNVSLPGTVSVDVNISNTTVVGSGTSFTRLNVGDRILTNNTYKYVSAITNDTLLTVSVPFAANVISNTVSKSYLVGDIIDLTGKGVDAGATRTVVGNTSTQIYFDLKETYATSLSANVSFSATRTSAREISKVLRPNRFVKINCAQLTSNTAPISLGLSDVFQIRQIRKDTSPFTTNTQGTLVTSSFNLDNGQRDDMYDTAKIIPRTPLNSNEHLLIELDYFYPDFSQGAGYFSVDSYPINDSVSSTTTMFTHEIPVYKSTSTGTSFDLRNCLDFRPVKDRTANDATVITNATNNPSNSNTFIFKDANGLRIPSPNSQLITDYQYYLARNDFVVCGTDGTITVVQGIPDVNPNFPSVPEDTMILASLVIPPYPSLSYTYARILGKDSSGIVSRNLTNRRFTMKDIGVLKQRIDNLEYYNAVNLLEKSATDLLILDENGLDRFKNGFFVDGFLDHSLGATYNPDYKICVDKLAGEIRPTFIMDSFAYSNNTVSLSNVVRRGNLILLNYTEKELINQSRATTIRNIEQSSYRFIGNLYLTPDRDVWVDETVVDKTFDLTNGIKPSVAMTTEWNSWKTYVTGTTVYKVYSRGKGNRNDVTEGLTLLGTFNDYASAQTAASSVKRSKIETITTSVGYREKTGVQTTVTTDHQLQDFGTFVTDVSIIPYIRPQTINMFARGLKANTQYYTFFDNENMSSYVTPIVDGELTNEGGILRSDTFGELNALLRLPAEGKRFRTGEREVIVTDNPTNAVDSTTYAKNFFFASGLNVTKQKTVVSTVRVVTTEENVSESKAINQKVRSVEILGPSCMAYSFKVEVPPGVSGAFVTSADVFIQAKDPNLGVWFEIRAMSPDGGITRTQVPYSEVWYKSSEVTTTSDATVPHTVTFPAPVYLLADTQYAFVIHTEGLNPNYYFWVSSLTGTGATAAIDVVTKTPVTGRPLTGTLFTTNNNLNWLPVADTDLKIVIKRASFNPASVGTATIGNKGYEFFTVANTSQDNYSLYGETIEGSAIVTLSNVVGANTIIVTDKFSGPQGLSNVVAISGSTYYTTGFNLTANASISVLSSAGISKSITAKVSSVVKPQAKLMKYDQANSQIQLFDSTGNFFTNGKIRGVSSNNVADLVRINDWAYSTIELKPKQLLLQNTSCTFGYKGIKSSTGTIDPSFTIVPSDETIELPSEYVLKSRTNEVSNYSGANSSQIIATFTTENEFVSPIAFDLGGTNIVAVRNIINSDTTNEGNPSGGNLVNRYISKTVTLADGQDAEDIIVYVSAYVPPTTDVKVWAKLMNVDDPDTFEAKPYIELVRQNPGVVSSVSDKENFIELAFKIPASYMTGVETGAFEYTSNSIKYTSFKQFAIKIGLLATDSAVIPRATDVRVIALQM
ncbi:MAG: DUF4815 domain-containing protein [Terrimicrobiaceae bacterium]